PLVVDGNLSGTPTRLFYYQNTLYSVYALADTTAKIVEGYQYDAYGRQTVYSPATPGGAVTFTGADTITAGGSSQVGNPYLFTGRRLDAETNLYFYRARAYDAIEGRFLQRDPLDYTARLRGGAALRNYLYTQDAPVDFVDPLGLQRKVDCP